MAYMQETGTLIDDDYIIPNNVKRRQLIALMPVLINMLLSGYTYSFMNSLENLSHTISATTDDISQIKWIYEISQLLFTIPIGILSDIVGRKLMLISSGIIISVAWSLMSALRSKEMLYCITILISYFSSTNIVLCIIYIGEIIYFKLREQYCAIMFSMIYAGIALQLIFKNFSIFIVSAVSFVISLLLLTSMYLLKESPYYLIMTKNYTKAEKEVAWLLLNDEKLVEPEIESIRKCTKVGKKYYENILEIVTLINRRCLFFATTLCVLSQIGMKFIFPFGNFVNNFVSDKFDTYFSIIVFIITLIPVFVHHLPRGPCIIFSSLICSLVLIIIGFLSFLKLDNIIKVPGYSIVIGIFSLIFVIAYVLAIGLSLFTFTTEIYATNVRAIGISLTCFVYLAMNLVIQFIFQIFQKYSITYIMLWYFSIQSVIISLFTYFLLPDTKGKSLIQVQYFLRNRA